MNILNLVNQQYVNLKNDRFKDWFGSFLAHTNQKKQSAELLKSVISVLLGNRFDCKIFDVGAGEGTLAKNIVGVLKANCNNIYYSGLELIESYAVSANKTLQSLNISLANIHQGNFSNKADLLKMPDDADIILASHVAYYAKNVTEFAIDIADKAADSTRLVIIHQSAFSKASELRDIYRLDTAPASPQQKIKEALEYKGFKVEELYYPATITFPNDVTIQEMIDAVSAGTALSPEAQTVRNLLEFIFHVPLEYLQDRNELEHCGKIIEKILRDQSNHFIVWDVFQIATRQKLEDVKTSSTPMQRHDAQDATSNAAHDFTKDVMTSSVKFESKAVNIKDFAHINLWTLRPVELASCIGNVGIVRQLKSQIGEGTPFMGLNLASRNGHIAVVQELLEVKGLFDLNIKSEKGRTALHLAAQFNHPYIVKLLVYAEVDISLEDNDGHTALYLSANGCNIKVTEILWNHTNAEELGAEKISLLYQTLWKGCIRSPNVEVYNLLNVIGQEIYKMAVSCRAKIFVNYEYLKQLKKPDDEIVRLLTPISDSKACKGSKSLDEFLGYQKLLNKAEADINADAEHQKMGMSGDTHTQQDEL